MDATTTQLSDLARHHGVALDYHDIFGNHVFAEPEALVKVLRALGSPIDSPEDADIALRHDRLQRLRQVIPPVIVAWDGELPNIPFRVSATIEHLPIDLELLSDDNTVHRRRINPDAFVPIDSEEFEGEIYHTRVLLWGERVALGYHTLVTRVGGMTRRSLVIAAPARAYRGQNLQNGNRTWGVFAPVYALTSERNWGAGDYTDLGNLSEVVGDLGGGVVGTLPLLPTVIDDSNTPSPYAPISRLFWNEFFIDVDRLPELDQSASAREIMNSRAFRDERDRLRSRDECDFPGGMSLKRRVLNELARSLTENPSARRQEFEQYVRDNQRLVDFAQFRAAMEKYDGPWQTWPHGARDGALTRADYDPQTVLYHQYVQWVADAQVADVAEKASNHGPGLYLDFPLGVHPDSYDVWRDRAVFAHGVSVGAPPDGFFVKGQDWGFPPLNPEASRRTSHQYLISCVRHHLKHAGMLRIDHVMGLHRLFWVPHGLPATKGVYVEQPAEELYAILCLESHRSRALIVGEDLGTVADEVREAMTRHGLKRMYVAQFDMKPNPERAIGEVIEDSVAALNTHDTATFAGFWDAGDVDDRVALGHMSEEEAAAEREQRAELRDSVVGFLRRTGDLTDGAGTTEVLRAVLRYMCRQRPDLALINIEDLWLERHPQNIPGTVDERPNWKRRARYSVESLAQSPEIVDTLRDIARLYGKDHDMTTPSLPVTTTPSREAGPVDHQPTLQGDHDRHLFNEGTHLRLYDILGAHIRTENGTTGVTFGVWAPDADAVYVMGDFNGWNNSSHRLTTRHSSGIWEGFIPGLGQGQNYKFYIHSRYNGYRVQKADPFAFHTETPPKSASVVWDLDYEWQDHDWMRDRKRRNALDGPMAVYEVHIGSWMRMPEEENRYLTYRELAPRLTDHVLRMGFTHVEFLPVMEHPFYGSWGYQVTGYFAPTSRYGTPQDFMYLVDYLHQHGIAVILDWVPSHFPTDEHGLGYFDGTHLYEHADRRLGFHPDWNSWIFNYGRNEVRSFLLSSALFWLDKYHADGLRVDGVASMLYRDYSREGSDWLPNEYGGRENLEAISFLRQFNAAIYEHFPDVQTIAEESTDWPMVSRPTYIGGLGFGLKWDMGWMHDTLLYMSHNPIYRQYHHNELTFRMLYAFYENFALPLSHDEVVHGKGSLLNKMPGDEWQKFANLRLLFGYMYGQAGKKLLFMGAELAQWSEWYHETSLDWHLTEYAP
ncbi:MAG: 1,4-alpha-glucan branching protein GlgB, partial [candidate division Zixibacteria bacterium]|nr:1,4-alpha-glucan branching protein GlgB [candidate division Zixibacteria bacterium]